MEIRRIREDEFEPIAQDKRDQFIRFFTENAAYPSLLGMQFEEIRADYARMRLPYRAELDQPAGLVHGGAIASLIDTVVVGTIISTLDRVPRKMLTIDLHVHYLDAVRREDIIAEGITRRRGRSTIFLEVDAFTEAGTVVAHGEMAYKLVL